MFGKSKHIFNNALGLDIGTANVVMCSNDKGIVADEPSLVLVKDDGTYGNALVFGTDAKKILDRTPSGLRIVSPLANGVIADFDLTCSMVKKFMQGSSALGTFSKPTVAVGVPACSTEVDKNAVVDVALQAGAKQVVVVSNPIAAALGNNLPLDEPIGAMIVSIGAGICEAASISLGGIAHCGSINVAGNSFDESIKNMLRMEKKFAIGSVTAEEIKINIGTVLAEDKELFMNVRGKNLVTGLPDEISLSSRDVAKALNAPVMNIVELIHNVLEGTSPELVRDIFDNGIILDGGSAQLRGLAGRLAQELNIPFHVSENPFHSVAAGLAKVLEISNGKRSIPVEIEKIGR